MQKCGIIETNQTLTVPLASRLPQTGPPDGVQLFSHQWSDCRTSQPDQLDEGRGWDALGRPVRASWGLLDIPCPLNIAERCGQRPNRSQLKAAGAPSYLFQFLYNFCSLSFLYLLVASLEFMMMLDIGTGPGTQCLMDNWLLGLSSVPP